MDVDGQIRTLKDNKYKAFWHFLDGMGRYGISIPIVAHNHPSGVAEPSQADERITRRLKSALELVDIRLLDHLIIGDAGATSLASRGLL